MMKVMSKQTTQGFTLIEVLVATAVLMGFLAAVLSILQTAITSIGMARLQSQATRLAEEQLEMARNLPYNSVGTVGGIPAGSLSPTKTVVINGTRFTIKTVVLYIDDVYDNTAPVDLLPADYKRVRVAVTWEGLLPSKVPVVVLSDVAPRGMETTNGGGTIIISVFDSQGLPITNASVHLEAADVSPSINMDALTDTYGRVILPGAPACVNCYHVTVTKTGYTSERTYSTDEVANPTNPHLTVLSSQVTQLSFAIDTMSTLTVKATRPKQSSYAPFTGAQFLLQGTKEIGRTVSDEPVYKVNRTVTTGTMGQVTVTDLEWDTYTVSFMPTSSIDFGGSWPSNPIILRPGDNLNFNMVVQPATLNSLLVRVENQSHLPIDTAVVQLLKPGFVATESAGLPNNGDWGQSFFPNLQSTVYDLVVSATGYAQATASVTINGDRVESFQLTNESATP